MKPLIISSKMALKLSGDSSLLLSEALTSPPNLKVAAKSSNEHVCIVVITIVKAQKFSEFVTRFIVYYKLGQLFQIGAQHNHQKTQNDQKIKVVFLS